MTKFATYPKTNRFRYAVQRNVVPARFDYVLPYANDESGLIEMQVIIENPREEVLGSRCPFGMANTHGKQNDPSRARSMELSPRAAEDHLARSSIDDMHYGIRSCRA